MSRTKERLRVGIYAGECSTDIKKPCLAIWPESVETGTLGTPITLVSPLEKVNDRDRDNAQRLVDCWNAFEPGGLVDQMVDEFHDVHESHSIRGRELLEKIKGLLVS